ncbi:MAG: DUF2306 domain-containing protein [Terriglobales bacterium]|jgi:hypothetical protein|nr:DUF2306 domain-containing protein [Terriglobales bacterium]
MHITSQSGIAGAAGRNQRRSPLWIRVGFWVCTVISVAVVFRRVIALARPPRSAPLQLAALDAVFASHATLTLLHILTALAFVLVSPFVVFRRFANAVWPERLIYPLGAVVGFTAYAMSVYSIGGWVERSAVLFFNSLFLYSLFRSYSHLQHSQQLQKRRWMLRAIAILLGIATTRPVMGIFFATSRLTHLAPSQFFGIAFWIGFSINTFLVEFWLRSRDRQTPMLAGC